MPYQHPGRVKHTDGLCRFSPAELLMKLALVHVTGCFTRLGGVLYRERTDRWGMKNKKDKEETKGI